MCGQMDARTKKGKVGGSLRLGHGVRSRACMACDAIQCPQSRLPPVPACWPLQAYKKSWGLSRRRPNVYSERGSLNMPQQQERWQSLGPPPKVPAPGGSVYRLHDRLL